MSRAGALVMLVAVSGCDWLSAAEVVPQYCADFSSGPATDQKLALLSPCKTSSECPCPGSICSMMQVLPDGGAEGRCNPPDQAARTCPMFFNSMIVQWKSGSECLFSCPASDRKQCIGYPGVHLCKLSGECD